MKVEIYVKFNQYESKRYFSRKLADAFIRAGVETSLLDSDSGSFITKWEKQPDKGCDLACSFNRFQQLPDGKYMWEKTKVPFISMLIDPAIYNAEAYTTSRSMATCVDRFDCAYANSFGRDNTLFWPHAIEPGLHDDGEEKIYPVVLIGSCYDPDNLKAYWTEHLPKEMCDIINEAIELSFADITKPFYQATIDVLQKRNLKISDVPFESLYYYVDNYMRGWDRIQLVRSIKDTEIHIFGGTVWRPERPIAGWNRYTAAQRNIVLHPAVTFEESLQILKKSKICLNSIPTLRNGSHERVLASYACGGLPISSDNLFWREELGDDIVLYPYDNRQIVAEKVKELLENEPMRKSMVDRGREKVLQRHTWDQRVRQLLEALPALEKSL